MATESLTRPVSKLYDDDFVAWASETARLLREGRFGEIDIENLAEEVEAMAGRDRREMASRLTILMMHLLKWQQQPGKRSSSWRSTIATQRAELQRLLKQSPSLRREVPQSVTEVYEDAVEQASIDTGIPEDSFPRECPFSPDQILDRSFLPST